MARMSRPARWTPWLWEAVMILLALAALLAAGTGSDGSFAVRWRRLLVSSDSPILLLLELPWRRLASVWMALLPCSRRAETANPASECSAVMLRSPRLVLRPSRLLSVSDLLHIEDSPLSTRTRSTLFI